MSLPISSISIIEKFSEKHETSMVDETIVIHIFRHTDKILILNENPSVHQYQINTLMHEQLEKLYFVGKYPYQPTGYKEFLNFIIQRTPSTENNPIVSQAI